MWEKAPNLKHWGFILRIEAVSRTSTDETKCGDYDILGTVKYIKKGNGDFSWYKGKR